jgi:hypothetical protein
MASGAPYPRTENGPLSEVRSEPYVQALRTTQRRQSWTCTAAASRSPVPPERSSTSPSTSLHLWFYAMYLITSTRCGSPRSIGARAWRPLQDRVADVQQDPNELMTPDEAPCPERSRWDDDFVGGKPREADRRRRAAMGWNAQTDYWSARRSCSRLSSGAAYPRRVVPIVEPSTILPESARVRPARFDELHGRVQGERAASARKGYTHHRIHSSKPAFYVDGERHTTQTIDGILRPVQVGRSVALNHHAVSHTVASGLPETEGGRGATTAASNGNRMFPRP